MKNKGILVIVGILLLLGIIFLYTERRKLRTANRETQVIPEQTTPGTTSSSSGMTTGHTNTGGSNGTGGATSNTTGGTNGQGTTGGTGSGTTSTTTTGTTIVTSGMTKFGAQVVLPSNSVDEKIKVLRSLGLSYVRNAIQLATWQGRANDYNKYIAAGFHVLLNISWQSSSQGVIPFPTDMVTYASRLTSVLDTISKPELVVIENEEINKNFHSGPLSDYINEVKTAAPIVHAHGLKMANGGVYGTGLDVLVYRYLKGKYGEAFAENNYGNYVFLPGSLKAINSPGTSSSLEDATNKVLTVLQGVAPYVDYINIHHYEVDNPNLTAATVTTVTPNVLKYTKEYIETTYGKPIMSNETSIRGNNQPALVTSLLQDYVNNQYPYVIWFDNTDGNKYNDDPLNDGTTPYTLRSNGQAFHDFVVAH